MKYTCPCCQATFEIEVTVTPLVVPKTVPKRAKAPMTELKRFGEYQHVVLLDADYKALIATYGEYIVEKTIKTMDRWVEDKKKPYKDYALQIRNWADRDLEKNPYLKEKLPVKEVKKEFDESHWE